VQPSERKTACKKVSRKKKKQKKERCHLLGGLSNCKDVTALVAVLELDIDLLVSRHHVVLKRPLEAAAQLGHNDVAVAKQVNVKVYMVDGLARDVDLGNMGGQPADNLGDGCDLERSADDDDEVDLIAVVFGQAAREFIGQGLAEEGNVGLHDAGLRHIVLGVIVRVVVRGAAFAAAAIRGGGAALALDGGTQGLGAARTARDDISLDFGKDGLAVGLVAALDASSGAKGAVALDQAVLGDAGLNLEVVDVLGVVGEQLFMNRSCG
jgi:hypothetical protein